jgi:hypothetical protein
MLAPQVKIAHTIRSLVSVAETLRCGLQHRDPETDEILVDVKNTELYLKVRQSIFLSFFEKLNNHPTVNHFSQPLHQVVSQITNAYKLKGSDLMFNRQ